MPTYQPLKGSLLRLGVLEKWVMDLKKHTTTKAEKIKVAQQDLPKSRWTSIKPFKISDQSRQAERRGIFESYIYPKFFLVIFLLSTGTFISHSQAQSKTDSLIDALERETIDTNRLNILMALSGSLYRSDPDLGIKYSLEAIDFATNMKSQKDLGYALKNAGLGHYVKSEFREVVNYWEQSLKVFREINDAQGISNLLSNLGAVYQSKADYSTALEYNIESLKFAEQSNDTSRIATSLINIGTIYSDDELTYDKGQETFEKVLELSKNLNRADITGTTYNNLGELLFRQNKPKEALPYFQKAYDQFEQLGTANTAYVLNFISKIYIEIGDFKEALNYADKAYSVAKTTDSKIEVAQAAITKGEIYNKLSLSDKSLASYKEGESIAKLLETNKELSHAYEGIAQTYALLGRHRSAYKYQLLNNEVKEMIRSSENDEMINNLRFKLDLEQKEKEIEILNRDNALKEIEISRSGIIQKSLLGLGALLLIIIGGITFLYNYSQKANRLLGEERNRVEKILLNTLPKDTADELQEKGYVVAKRFDQTTVLFTDFMGFTSYSEGMTPEQLVKSIDYYFSKFDEIIGRYNLEKIKTIGDAYMCAGGLPIKNSTNAKDAVKAALEIASFVKEVSKNPPTDIEPIQIRIGINTGSTVAGVVGTKKFQYDIWGSTVNVASRMESASESGQINISDNTYQLIKNDVRCTYRGEIEVKNGLKLKMYYVNDDEHVHYNHNLHFDVDNMRKIVVHS